MPPFLPHALAMAAGFVCMLGAAVLAMFFRRKRWWLKVHRILGFSAAVCVLAGLLAAALNAEDFFWFMFNVPHGALGLLVIAATLATPVAGVLQFKVRNRPRMRLLHRVSGRGVILLAAVEISLGLMMVM